MYSVEGDKSYQIRQENGDWFIDDDRFQGSITAKDSDSFLIISNNKTVEAFIESYSEDRKSYIVRVNHIPYELKVKDRMDLLMDKMGINSTADRKTHDIKAPMPGLILDIHVKEGDLVTKGQKIMVLEAMKMENIIKAENDAEIKEVLIEKGQSVEKNQIMIRF